MNRGRIDENPSHWLIAIGNVEMSGLGVCIRVMGYMGTGPPNLALKHVLHHLFQSKQRCK